MAMPATICPILTYRNCCQNIVQSKWTLFRNNATTPASTTTTTSHRTPLRLVIALSLSALVLLRLRDQSHLFSPVELADHASHIFSRLVIWRDAVILVHRAGPGVVGCQCQRQVIMIPSQQSIQIGRSASDILVWPEGIIDAHRGCRARHQLHQPASPRPRNRLHLSATLRSHYTGEKVFIDMVSRACMRQHLL